MEAVEEHEGQVEVQDDLPRRDAVEALHDLRRHALLAERLEHPERYVDDDEEGDDAARRLVAPLWRQVRVDLQAERYERRLSQRLQHRQQWTDRAEYNLGGGINAGDVVEEADALEELVEHEAAERELQQELVDVVDAQERVAEVARLVAGDAARHHGDHAQKYVRRVVDDHRALLVFNVIGWLSIQEQDQRYDCAGEDQYSQVQPAVWLLQHPRFWLLSYGGCTITLVLSGFSASFAQVVLNTGQYLATDAYVQRQEAWRHGRHGNEAVFEDTREEIGGDAAAHMT